MSTEYKDNTPSLDDPLSPSATYHVSDDLVRIVSPKECFRLRANVIRVLKDNNYDILYDFNLSEFIPIFSKILPSSAHEEITKLFNLLCSKPANVLSFGAILNNNTNFNVLLESMGCIIDNDDTNNYREYDVNKPLLSWRSNTNNSDICREYIEYQRDVIDSLNNEINAIYKPLVLQNKEMQINMESLSKQVNHLKLERDAMQNEIELLEKEVIQMRNDYVERDENDDNIQMLQRRISCSYAEIQESHEFLENEIFELQQNLQQTRRQSNKRNDEYYKLQEINEKYNAINDELRNNFYQIKQELNGEKKTVSKQNEDINQLKYELFEKDQRIALLNKTVDDMSQQLQFLSNNNYAYKRSKRRKRSMECFDIFNDIVVSPKSVQHAYGIQMAQEEQMHHCNVLQLEMEHAINKNHYPDTRKIGKEIATQTVTKGFWQMLLAQIDIRCVDP